MRKWWIGLGVGVLFIAAAMAWLWTGPPPSPLRSRFDQVQVGMTKAEVEAVLGKPVGATIRRQRYEYEFWHSEKEMVSVGFANDTVAVKEFQPPTSQDRVWQWLRSMTERVKKVFSD